MATDLSPLVDALQAVQDNIREAKTGGEWDGRTNGSHLDFVTLAGVPYETQELTARTPFVPHRANDHVSAYAFTLETQGWETEEHFDGKKATLKARRPLLAAVKGAEYEDTCRAVYKSTQDQMA